MSKSDESHRQILKAQLFDTARAMRDNKVSFLEGARQICSAARSLGLEKDPDINAFILIDSETDALPLGELRRHWLPEALAKLEPELRQAETWARSVGSKACESIISRFEDDARRGDPDP